MLLKIDKASKTIKKKKVHLVCNVLNGITMTTAPKW